MRIKMMNTAMTPPHTAIMMMVLFLDRFVLCVAAVAHS